LEISLSVGRESAGPETLGHKHPIHDNFVLVQGIAKELHRKKILALFLKLDIGKAFDSLSWAYLLKVLEILGFGAMWRNWISLALASSSSRILLNGLLGHPIKHERGLRQGDPISPMLFILAMEPLQRILHTVVQKGVLSSISPRSTGIKASLYASATTIFVKPQKQDIAALKEMIEMFGQASRLCTNL
jgi:hypothetical protein